MISWPEQTLCNQTWENYLLYTAQHVDKKYTYTMLMNITIRYINYSYFTVNQDILLMV